MILPGLILGYGLWKADAFWNYYQFTNICAEQGGLVVFEKLEKGAGWASVNTAYDHNAKESAALMPNIGFYRAIKAKEPQPGSIEPGTLVDVRYLGGARVNNPSAFSVAPADLSKKIKYIEAAPLSQREHGNRITRSVLEIQDAEIRKTLIRHTNFTFHWRTIPVWHWFGPAGTTECPIPYPPRESVKSLVEQINELGFKD